jgi:hypothetical protein
MDKDWVAVIQAIVDRTRDFPPEARNELLSALGTIERKYDLIEPLTPEERDAVQEGLHSLERGEGIPVEEVMKSLGIHDYDRDTAGKEDLEEVLSQVRKLSGRDQGRIARLLFSLIDEDRLSEK